VLKADEKAFDCVRLMRELRDELTREVESMTAEQRLEFIRERADRVWKNLGLAPTDSPWAPEARTH
jgi:uncharacterized protein (DUF2164 family)